MPSVNNVTLMGHLGQDPDFKTVGDKQTPLCTLNLATQNRFKKADGTWDSEPEWHRVVVWNKQAEYIRDNAKKGDLVYVEGRVSTRKWEDDQGQTHYTTEIVARNTFAIYGSQGGSKGKATSGSPQQQNSDPVASLGTSQPAAPSDNSDGGDDELPF